MWCDLNAKNPYIAITAHWIVLDDGTAMLVLKAGLIAFHCIPGSHTGEALGLKILHLLDRAEVTNNVGVWFYHASCSDLV
jgi:hypothetical protein